MTKLDTERIIKMEVEQKGMAKDIAEIKKLITAQNKKIDGLFDRFVLRREAWAVAGVLTILIGAVGLAVK